MTSFYWHDYETFGIDPRRDRACQFAGIRTDEDFNVIGKPLTLYCQPTPDFLPNPEACLVTGISPQDAMRKGVIEAEFIQQIYQEMSQANTCSVGYNSIRFDDEFTRNLLYRNCYDPYEREYKLGNSRWDIIDLARITRALRPEGINWVDDDKGIPSFRLDKLTIANGIEHGAAHDALADVYATIELAKLIKQQQPKLYNFVFNHRSKASLNALLKLGSMTPLLHISGMYPAVKGCLAMVVPLCFHPTNSNGVIVYDLSIDPEPLLSLTADEIYQRVFTAANDLPEGIARIPLKTVHINKCPVLAPISVLRSEDAERLQLDKTLCLNHLAKLSQRANWSVLLNEVFNRDSFAEETNPDLMIYSGGFLNAADKAELSKIRQTPEETIADLKPNFRAKHLAELFFRYKARNYPMSLTEPERQHWQDFCQQRITDKSAGASIVLAEYMQRLSQLKEQPEVDMNLITALENYIS